MTRVGRASCLMVIVVALSAACALRASAEEPSCIRVRAVERVIQAEPGSVITMVVALQNQSAEGLDIDVCPELPESWPRLFADETVRLASGETDVLPIPVMVPKGAPSGEYEIPVYARCTCPCTKGCQSAMAAFTATVSEVRNIAVTLANGPDYVTENAYTASFLLSNQGNVVENLELSAREIRGAVVKLNPDRVRLGPGGSALADVHVKLKDDPVRVLDHTISIKAQSKDLISNSASASARVKVLPQKLSDSDAYHHFPLKVELSTGVLGVSSKGRVKMAGSGPLTYGGSDRLRFDLSHTGGFVEYRSPEVGLMVGDGKFSLSPLTEWEAKARGVGVQVMWEGAGFKLYAHDDPGPGRLGFRAATTPSPDSSLSLQFLAQEEPVMNVFTLRGSHRVPGGAQVDYEYGVLANGSDSAAQALRASGRAKLGPVEALVVVQNADSGYTALSSPGLDLSLRLKSVSTQPVSTSLLLQGHKDGELISGKLEAGAGWKLAEADLGLKYSDTVKWADSSDAASRLRQASVSMKLPDGNSSSLQQEISVQNRSSALRERGTWNTVYTLKREAVEGNRKLTSYVVAGMPFGQDARARLGLGIDALYAVARGLEIRGTVRAGDIENGGLTVSGGATYKLSDWAAISADASYKIRDGGRRDFAAQVKQTAFFDIPLARRSDVGEVVGEIIGVDGQGVPGLVVNVADFSIVTDSSGAFRFPSVVQGKHYISVGVGELGPEYLVMPSSTMNVHVEPGKTSIVSFTVARSGSISGIVRFAPGKGSDELPDDVMSRIADEILIQRMPQLLSGLLINVSGARRYVAQLDANGRFSFGHLPPGDYSISIDRRTIPALYELTPSAISLTLSEGEEASVEFTVCQIVREYDFTEGGELEEDPLRV